ncbi:NADH-quinone oxidoreductase subunit M [Sodalis sp. CWE]|uniref:NADH-quinone oxidoreductase subunit M n=1 Tax=Sodalis sp. CWE TaxID=2803816 RepID=UPI001C7DFBA3|nr:NADH-quinone oxidoreductase subunit M [Sodalis sp. CWE]MBX4181069.1 NADH-quinone oxidoreductase subunit M [Sodalis sp. CWE]
MLLPCLVLIPFIGGLLCWSCERLENKKTPCWIALITMVFTLTLSLFLWQLDNLDQGKLKLTKWKIEFLYPWIPRFNINIHLALDGLSILMVSLTGFFGILAVLCSWREVQNHRGLFYFNLLWIFTSVIGVFLAIDMFLFFLFWEMMLLPMFFLIVLWGRSNSKTDYKDKVSVAMKFCIYTQISGLVMLVSIFGLVMTHYSATGFWTFDYEHLKNTPMSHQKELLLMLGFFLSFAIKFPIVPLHGWLPDVHSYTPTAGSVDLAGVLLKTAAYGILRFILPLFPHASYHFAPIAMWLGLINIFYGALVALLQTDIKRLIAYIGISHMGLVLIAIYSGNQLACQGAVIQMIAHGLSASGMFIVCGQIYERSQKRDIQSIGRLCKRLNFIPTSFLFFTIATLGIPGTINFVGEIITLFGNFQIDPMIAVTATFGLVFVSICSLMIIYSVYNGPERSLNSLSDSTLREKLIVLSLAVLIILFGFFPYLIMDVSFSTIKQILDPNLLSEFALSFHHKQEDDSTLWK